MTKRRTSSPYPKPPSDYVRAVMRDGWRSCDAEALAMVAFCLEHALDDDGRSLVTLARHAEAALAKEPVLAAAVLRLAPIAGVETLSYFLTRGLPASANHGLRRLWEAAEAYDAVRHPDDLRALG